MGKRSKRNADRDEVGSDTQRSASSASKARRCRCGKEDKLPGKLFGEECMTAYRKLWEPKFMGPKA
jgi:predicted phage gp36 major capsid-like protein